MTARIYFAALALLGIFGTAELLKGRGMPTELAHLQLKLDQMPQRFGAWSWSGEEEHLDPRVFKSLGAELAINRQYRDGRAAVNLHSAVFLKYGVQILHPPELCYQGGGFVVANSEAVDISADGKTSLPAQLLALDRDDARIYCLYWYQIGDAIFSNADDQRRIVQSFRGKDTWPPMIKVMLQTSASSPEEAAGRLKALAALVYPWTRQYH